MLAIYNSVLRRFFCVVSLDIFAFWLFGHSARKAFEAIENVSNELMLTKIPAKKAKLILKLFSSLKQAKKYLY